MTIKRDAVTERIVDCPVVCRTRTSCCCPITGTVTLTKGCDAFDVRPLFIKYLNFEGIGVLAATNGISFGVEQWNSHRKKDFLRAGSAEWVSGIDCIGVVTVAKIPKVRRAWCRETLKLHWCVQAYR